MEGRAESPSSLSALMSPGRTRLLSLSWAPAVQIGVSGGGGGLRSQRSAAGLKSRPYGMSCNCLRDLSSAPGWGGGVEVSADGEFSWCLNLAGITDNS